jgi:hypothetical protein
MRQNEFVFYIYFFVQSQNCIKKKQEVTFDE